MKKAYFILAAFTGGPLILMAFLNVFLADPLPHQKPLIYPVAALNLFMGLFLIKKIHSLSQVDWKNTSKKSNLKQMSGYRLYFQKSFNGKFALYLFLTLMVYLSNIASMGQGLEESWSGMILLYGFYISIFALLFFFGWIHHMQFIAITEKGELETRSWSNYLIKKKFPLTEVTELKVHWHGLLPKGLKEGESKEAIKELILEEVEAASFQNLTEVISVKQRKAKSKNGTSIVYWPCRFEILDKDKNTLLDQTVNHEDKEEMSLYLRLPETVKISLGRSVLF